GSLFENYILAHDQAMGSHLLQRGQYALHVLVGIHEDDDDGQLSSRVHQMAGLNLVSSKKSSHCMERRRRVGVFFAQVIENFQWQRPMMPLVGFVEVNRDLNSHGVWHFTAPAPGPCRRVLLRGIADCCRERWSA